MATKTPPRKTVDGQSSKTKTDEVFINVPLPTALHRRLRMRQIERGLPTLGDAIAEAVTNWLK